MITRTLLKLLWSEINVPLSTRVPNAITRGYIQNRTSPHYEPMNEIDFGENVSTSNRVTSEGANR